MSKRNENRPGYKKTPIGWIPKDWDLIEFGKLAILQSNGFVGKATIHYSEATDSIPYIQGYNVKVIGIDYTGMKRISQVFHKKQRRSQLKTNDILTIQTGDIGVSCLVPENLDGTNCHALIITRIMRDKASPSYYCYYLNSTIGRMRIAEISTGSMLKHINTSDLRKWLVPYPSLNEQEKIVHLLSLWDRALTQFQKIISAKQQLKKGLMQHLLTGRLRFPEFGPSIKSKAELPNGWRKYRLGDCFKERNETNPDLTLLSITSDRGVIPRTDVERKDSSNLDKSKYKKITPGDIGYNTMRMWQGVSAVSTIEGIVSPAYTVCSPKNGMVSKYFGYLFKYALIIHKFHRHSQGLVNDTLNLKFHHFAKIKINIPEKMEQEKIALFLSVVDQEIVLLEKELKILKEQQKGLFQKLLTGEIRHPDYKKYCDNKINLEE